MKQVTFMMIIGLALFFFGSCADEQEPNLNQPKKTVPMEKIEEIPDISEKDVVSFTEKHFSLNLPARNGSEVIKFKGKYWFMGGESPVLNSRQREYFHDIWCSEDGKTWEKVLEEAPWGERSHFNLFVFDNKLWIVGGQNEKLKQADWYNDVWSSEDGETWTQVLAKGPWQTRERMAVSVHGNSMYLTGGHSLTNWHLYQDIWKSEDGETWKKVGEISDAILGNEQSRQGLNEHQIIHFKDEYFLVGGMVASTFTGFTGVLKSKDMLTWEVVTRETPWKEYSHLRFGNNRPLVYKDYLVFIIENEQMKIEVYLSKDGKNWELKKELKRLDNATEEGYQSMELPRGLVINEKIYLYGSYTQSLVYPILDESTHLIELTPEFEE